MFNNDRDGMSTVDARYLAEQVKSLRGQGTARDHANCKAEQPEGEHETSTGLRDS
jgi:hypothetical protein